MKRASKRETLNDQFRAHAADLGLDVDVLSEGPVNGTVAFVGEGPGEQEYRQGRPFVGGSGRLLFDVGRRFSISRDDVYCTNVVKRQISHGMDDDARVPVPADELMKWVGMLRWELQHMPNLRTVFCLGAMAMEALTDHTGILNRRGSVYDVELPNGKMGRVVCTLNPAYVMRPDGAAMEPFFIQDFGKLSAVLKGTFKPHVVNEIINPTFKEAMAYLRDLQRSKLPVSLDVEHSVGGVDETACYSLANQGFEAMCINFRGRTEDRFTVSQEYEILAAIQKLCDSHKIIVQGGGHEVYWCWHKDLIKIKPWMDNLLGHHLLYPRLPHSLAFQVAQYTNHPYYKDEFEECQEGGDIDQFWRYGCKDAALQWYIHQPILKSLQKQPSLPPYNTLDRFFFEHVMRAQPHCAAASVHGLAVDLSIKEKIVKMCDKDVKKIGDKFLEQVRELTGDPYYEINPLSWQQLKKLFFEELGLKGKGTSTDETNRQYMREHPDTPPLAKEMLTTLDEYKEEAKFNGTYAKSRPSEDNRMRCDYKQFGVTRAPGRLSSSELITGEGQNMQNQPMRARAMYVADPGMVFGYFDGEQAEARIVGWRARIKKWKEQFERARLNPGTYDCHRALCAEMFKMKYEDTPKKDWDEDGQPTKRYVSKRCRHGLNYRMQRARLAEVTKLPYHDAVNAFFLYHKITPELEMWWKLEERNFRRDGVIFNAYGRPFKVIQRINSDVLDSIIAFYPQSTVGDWIVRAWYMAEEDDDWPSDARICLNVHDNLVCQASPKTIKTALRVAKKYAQQPLMIHSVYDKPGDKPEPLIIPSDFKVSYPTRAIMKKDKETGEEVLDFVKDIRGLHRWSHMEGVQL